VLVDEALRDWLCSPDARGCIDQVRQLSGLSLAGLGSDERGIFTAEAAERLAPDSVILIGEEPAVRKATLLLDVHIMHQREVEAFHERRRKKLQQLKELQSKDFSGAAQVTFDVDGDLIGRTMGQGGQKAKRVEAAHEVEVRVVDVDGQGADMPKTVRILGKTMEAVEKAREELELLRVEYEVEEELVGWILGKGGKDIQELSQKAGLSYAPRLNEAGTALELCGLESSIENAKLLLDAQIEYFDIYQEMALQNDEIQRSFEALEVRAETVGVRLPGPRRKPAADGAQAPAQAQPRQKADGYPAGRGAGRAGGRGRGDTGRAGGNGRSIGEKKAEATEDRAPQKWRAKRSAEDADEAKS